MARPLRDPRQVHTLDRTTLRREAKRVLPPELMLDSQEWDELLDFSNQSARLNVLRKAWLHHRRAGLPAPRMLADSERQAVELFVLGEGPRPPFAKFATGDGHYGRHWLGPDDPDAPKAAPPWPEQLAGEPGRYVLPKGDFAIPSDRR